MPFGAIILNVEPPTKNAESVTYGPIYEALSNLEPGKWMAIPIEHTKETRIKEIANVRRAIQRYFELEEIKTAFGYRSRVTSNGEDESIMYVQKLVTEASGDGRK